MPDTTPPTGPTPSTPSGNHDHDHTAAAITAGAEFAALRRGAALWSPSWFVGTVGGPLEVVRRYVENQKRAA